MKTKRAWIIAALVAVVLGVTGYVGDNYASGDDDTSASAGEPPVPNVQQPIRPQQLGWDKVPSITVLTPRDDDSRVQLVRDAVVFWNERFQDLGTPFRLGPVTVSRGEVPAGYLPKLSEAVLSMTPIPAGQLPLPEGLRTLTGDIIIFLSDEEFVSFTSIPPIPGRPKTAFISIKNGRTYPLDRPNVARNVIAHEMGHALGLGHNSDPTQLMCGRPAACRPDEFISAAPKYFPLTDDEKQRLKQLYPAGWKASR